MYCQTQAINAYCGKLAKLPALSDIEELKNHMMNETCNEAFEGMVNPAFAAIGGFGKHLLRSDGTIDGKYELMKILLSNKVKSTLVDYEYYVLMYILILTDTEKNGTQFFDAMEGVLAEKLQNVEKALKALSVDGEFIPGKRTTADFNIANIYVALTTKSIRGGADKLKETPLLKKIIDGLLADGELGPLIEAAQNVQFFPFTRNGSGIMTR